MKIGNIEQTCAACPSQWEGKMIDGRCFYIRYRWGWLTLGLGNTEEEAIRNTIKEVQVGDHLDGTIDTYEMGRLLKLELPIQE